jgi:hypothetical protein
MCRLRATVIVGPDYQHSVRIAGLERRIKERPRILDRPGSGSASRRPGTRDRTGPEPG